jgi:putative peptidoglycan lipid II flippase
MVKASASKIKGFLNSTQDTILSAAFIISILYFLSAILGLFKSRILVTYYGASSELSLFFLADRIPTAIYSTLFLGSLSTVFIPIFLKIKKDDAEKAFKFASNLFNLVLIFFILISLLIFVFSKEILFLLSFGQLDLKSLDLASNLLNIMLIGQVILIISSFLTSTLNSYRNFVIPSLAPVVFNLAFMIFVPILYPFYGIKAAAYSMVISAFFHLFIQLPSFLRTGFLWDLVFNLKDRDLRTTFNLSFSSFLSTIISQITIVAETSLSLLISSASVVYFKFADQLRYFPVHLFGASIAIAALPILSAESEDNLKNFSETVKASLLQIIYLSVPVSVLLIILKIPIVRLVYGAEKFTWDDTVLTAMALAVFSLSIFSQSCNLFLTKCFYALKNTNIPLIGSIVTFVVTITFPLYFIFNGYQVWSVVLGFVIGTYVNFIYFVVKLKKLVPDFSLKELYVPLGKILLSGVFMSIFLYVPMQLLDNYVFNTTYVIELLALTGIVSLGGFLIYFLITYYFKLPEVMLMFKVLRKLKIKTQRLENLENSLNQSIS